MKAITNKKSLIILLPLLVGFGIFAIGGSTHAGWATDLMSGILSVFIWALGIILGLVLQGLIAIASYQHFIDSQAVVLGWVIVRDICNMFFVVVLMIIAFGTILHLEEYNYKKWLPKLILMAVLINFSKTICGVLIDVTQVAMLTFVNAFKDIGGGNATEMLGIKDIVTLSATDSDTGVLTVVGAYVLGVIYLIVSIVVIVTMMMMLVMRLVMIWIYVVLSPAAYLLAAFPGGQKYSSQWWSEFIKNLIVGPVLAFFIWLSLAALGTGNDMNNIDTATADKNNQQYNDTLKGDSFAGTEASKPSALIKFVIAIGMLVGGLMVSQQIGGAAGGMAGKGMSALQKGQSLAFKGAKKIAMGDNYLARKFAKATGWDFRPVKIKESIEAFNKSSKKKDETEIREKSKRNFEAGGLRSVAMGMGVGEDYFHRNIDGFLGYKGIARAGKEIFYNPGKRQELGGQIDDNEKNSKDLMEQRSNLVDSKKTEIDAQVSQALDQDSQYKGLRQSEFDQNMRIAQLRNNPRGKQEDDELKKLEAENTNIKTKREAREAEIRKDIETKVMGSDQGVMDIDAKIKINDEELKRLKDEIAKVQTPMAFEARSAYRKDVEEAKAKYKTITNADELMKAYADSQQREDKFDQIAILEKLSGDANLNEELNAKGYEAGAKGLYKYVFNKDNIDGKQKGLQGHFSEKERTQILNDLGETEERVGHWEMAKMAGMNSKGDMVSYVKEKRDKDGNVMKDDKGQVLYDDLDHAIAAYAEVIKFDPQKIVNSLNRLAYGGEDGAGDFQISNLGKMIYKYLASSGVYKAQEGRILGNTAANLSSPNVVPILKKLMEHDIQKSDEALGALTRRGVSKDAPIKPGGMAAWLRANKLD